MQSTRTRVGRSHSRSSILADTDLQKLGARIVIYGEIDDPGRRNFNPSITFHDGKLYIAVRNCNFAINPRGSWYLRDGNAYSKTDVLLAEVDPDSLRVGELIKLEFKNAPTRTLVCGLEDARIFSRKDGLHALGFESDRLTRSLHNGSACLAEYLIKGKDLIYLRTLKKPDKARVEKNWQPTDEPSANFDFTYSPTEIWKDGQVIGEAYKGSIHGGSQLLKQDDGTFLSIVHAKTADWRYGGSYNRFVYMTYLARHDKHGFITHLSKPFTFGTGENIEFASGMVEYKDHLLISFGIRDAKFGIAEIKKSMLVNMLEGYDGH